MVAQSSPSSRPPSARKALEKLQNGNSIFVKMALAHPNLAKKIREELVEGQAPFAVVLACADSRLVPEFIFDAGLGDLFCIEIAGNIANVATIGSIEYALKELRTKLVVVIGHERCGAVHTAIKYYGQRHESSFITSLVESIEPSVRVVKAMNNGDAPWEEVAHMNARMVAQQLREESSVFEGTSGVRVVSAYYELKTGRATFH
jgi:carbonic anhydrase